VKYILLFFFFLCGIPSAFAHTQHTSYHWEHLRYHMQHGEWLAAMHALTELPHVTAYAVSVGMCVLLGTYLLRTDVTRTQA
jgi:hypothetical protein